MNYSTFKLLVADQLARYDITTEISSFVTQAIQKLSREQLYFLQTSTALTCTNAQTYVSLPSDFVQEARLNRKSCILDSSGDWLEKADADILSEYQVGSAGTGQPTLYSILNARIELYPIPNSNYSLRLYYYKQLDAPADTSSNAWTTTASDLLFFATLSEAYDYLEMPDKLLKAEMKKDKLLQKFRSISGKLSGTGQVKYNEV